MSTLTKIFNPITGTDEWEEECEEYEYHQEIARTGFGDMLHDTERNQKYYAALKKTIDCLHADKRKAHVLDIGTGTGLLSMMAVQCGADSVTACEAFQPMAKCAKVIIEDNGMSDKIHLIMKRSTDICMDEKHGDMKQRANVLVTELFDTELIGEGAIDIFNHAHLNLLTDDCIVIPSLATVYTQVVESPVAVSWNKPKLLANLDGEVLLQTPTEIDKCPGDAGVHDIQLNQFRPTQSNPLKPLSNPIEIFTFDFTSKTAIKKNRNKIIGQKSTNHGSAQVIFFWWEINMDSIGDIKISCAPFWAHPDYCNLKNEFESKQQNVPIQNMTPWRDHWMQGVYFLPRVLTLQKDQEYFLIANHDEYSFWFDVSSSMQNAEKIEKEKLRHTCSCGFHIVYSRTRIGQMNQNLRNKQFLRVLELSIDNNSNVLSFSDGSLLNLSIAQLGAKSVCSVERYRVSRECMQSYVKQNKLENVTFIENIDNLTELENITHVVCEPSFLTSILPWDSFYYGTLFSRIQSKLNKNVNILPRLAHIHAIPIEFLDLDKIQRPIGVCEGFNLASFDKFIHNSAMRTPLTKIEAQPLWEYPGRAIGKPKTVLSVDFTNYLNSMDCSSTLTIDMSGSLNGIGLWVDWDLDGKNDPKTTVTTGPNKPIEIGEIISWDMFVRQGVALIPNPINVKPGDTIDIKVSFTPSKGKILFEFDKF